MPAACTHRPCRLQLKRASVAVVGSGDELLLAAAAVAVRAAANLAVTVVAWEQVQVTVCVANAFTTVRRAAIVCLSWL